ncbi:glycosyltransferase family 9 protein [Cellulomonas sp. PhB143]|uniref:glycosyltransferase family 9 protein n=1 Tax=Cellulomonas sp. PhB143 TaxID=2485186 RepID=UPI000F4910B8|nr:glycosyltransferase family 9 protein [Cellulomonas sp. PhB143]ROS79016.1 ADP-heptose:LPS heptosyltransferase [Cellulomonas sp. PhB143]
MSGGTVLVLRALGLGDALAGVAALRGVRRAWPGHRVLLAASPGVGAWFTELGIVDGTVRARGLEPLAAPAGAAAPARPEVAVNLHGSGPQSHRVLLATAPGRLVAFASPDAGVPGPAWEQDEHEVDRWCRLVRSAGGACSREDLRLTAPGPRRGHVVVHPGAASASRRWPEERFAEVARALAAAGHDVVVTGSEGEAATAARVAAAAGRSRGTVTDTAGTLDLPALADVVATAGAVVCGDTGVAHLATAFGTPSVVLFGPTPPRLWGPALDPRLHAVLWHGGAPGAGDEDRAREHRGDPHGAAVDPALARVTVPEVLEALAGLPQPAAG